MVHIIIIFFFEPLLLLEVYSIHIVKNTVEAR